MKATMCPSADCTLPRGGGGDLNSIDCVMGQYGISISGEGIIASIRLSIKVAFSLCGVGWGAGPTVFRPQPVLFTNSGIGLLVTGPVLRDPNENNAARNGVFMRRFRTAGVQVWGVSSGDVINREMR